MRSLFPVLNSSVYLNTAYVGLMSKELFSYRKKIDSDFLNDGDKFKIDSLEKIFVSISRAKCKPLKSSLILSIIIS